MLQDEPDYIIATGKTISLEKIELVFKYLGLNWLDHVIINDSLLRPTIFEGYANQKRLIKF